RQPWPRPWPPCRPERERMIHTDGAYQRIIDETRAWVDRAVIGLNLCPFAKAVQVKQQVRYAASDASDAEGVLADLEDELIWLSQADPQLTDTTLLIVPDAMADFYEFNDFADL